MSKGNEVRDVIVIGIAGGTSSGKTTITQEIERNLGSHVTVITHDSYYKAHPELSYDERVNLNYDHPDSYDTEALVKDLADLRKGKAVESPIYDYTAYDRSANTMTIQPSKVIIVEGIMIFHEEALRDLMDIKVFVDADADIRILRRITRDVKERGRSLDSVISQYLTTVKPMHDAFVDPSKRYADIIIPGGGKNPVALEMLIGRIKAHLNQFSQ